MNTIAGNQALTNMHKYPTIMQLLVVQVLSRSGLGRPTQSSHLVTTGIPARLTADVTPGRVQRSAGEFLCVLDVLSDDRKIARTVIQIWTNTRVYSSFPMSKTRNSWTGGQVNAWLNHGAADVPVSSEFKSPSTKQWSPAGFRTYIVFS